MSAPVTLDRQDRLPPHRRLLPLAAVGAARLLARTRPVRIHAVLRFARRGANRATAEQALAARQDVVAVSLRCAGQGCLQRSIAAALLCRSRGTWPTWRTGVRTYPFAAHAWIEADDQPVGEPYPAGYYKPLLTIPPTGPSR